MAPMHLTKKLVAISLLPGLGLAFWLPARSLITRCSDQQMLGLTADRRSFVKLFSEPEAADSGSEDEGNSDGNDESNSVGNDDWRAFRAKLVSGGLKSTEDEAEPDLNAPAPRDVARKNTALLREQNPELAEEYTNGVWAHALPAPEPGCLLARRPFAAELLQSPGPIRTSILKAAKKEMLESITSSTGYLAEGGMTTAESNKRFEAWCANGAYMYRMSEKIIQRELNTIIKAASVVEKNPKKALELTEAQINFVRRYEAHSEQWQQVVLVLDYDPSKGATGVVINRPISKGVNKELGAILTGGKKALERAVTGQATDAEVQALSSFVRAFAGGVVYQGGSDGLDDPGLLVHGNPDVFQAATTGGAATAADASAEQCREISRGARIYVGGVSAAVEALASGQGQALDYRLFVGRKEWAQGELEKEVRQGLWQCAACARPVALKQCLALPKPLWHEVMELLGGDAEMLSQFELVQRTDLDTDDDDDDDEDHPEGLSASGQSDNGSSSDEIEDKGAEQ